MHNNIPTLLALDFDGVICDGSIEYFQTTKRTYYRIWASEKPTISDALAPTYYRLRAVIESGWEMPILMRAMILGISEEKIFQNWPDVAREILETEKLDRTEISHQLDRVRDEWIEADLDEWLALHRFYPGVIEKIHHILNTSIKFCIVTTKEARFVSRLLQQEKIELDDNAIIGKKAKRPKYATLRELMRSNSVEPANLWFVEDRLEALDLVRQQSDLQSLKLYLAEWGYNTQQTRNSLRDRQDIKLLSLKQFQQDFPAWP
jgi:phosphoglycolate phosphatase-like HAD superfamily hydrolase